MQTTSSLLLFLALAVPALSHAQTSKQSCPVPGGVKCMNALLVYQATESMSSLESVRTAQDEKALRARLAAGQGAIAVQQQALMLDGSAPATATPTSFWRRSKPEAPLAPEPVAAVQPAPNVPASGEPYRTPAQVLRIWMAPWEDTTGDLHMPGYVFSEIQGRRWTVAEPAPALAPELRLITPDASSASASN